MRDDVAQILSQDHTAFAVWLGDPFHDKDSEQFVARYIRLRRGYGGQFALIQIDTVEAMVRQAHQTIDELPSYYPFEPAPDEF